MWGKWPLPIEMEAGCFFSLKYAGFVNSGRSHLQYVVSIVIIDQGLFGNVNSNNKGLWKLPARNLLSRRKHSCTVLVLIFFWIPHLLVLPNVDKYQL